MLPWVIGSLLPTIWCPSVGALSVWSMDSWQVVYLTWLSLSMVDYPKSRGSNHENSSTCWEGFIKGSPQNRSYKEGLPVSSDFCPLSWSRAPESLDTCLLLSLPPFPLSSHIPRSPVFSLNNTSQSNQINHPLSASSPGGLFGECGTIFLSLYLLPKASGSEQ